MARNLFPLVDVLIGTPSTGPRLGAPALLTHGVVLNLYVDEACTAVLDATTTTEPPATISSVTVTGVTIPRFYGSINGETTVYARPAGATGNGFPLYALGDSTDPGYVTALELDNRLASYPAIDATSGKIAATVIPTNTSAVANTIPIRKTTSAAVAVGDPVATADAVPLGFGDNRYAAKGTTGGGTGSSSGDVRTYTLQAADLTALATTAYQSTDATTWIPVPKLRDATLTAGLWLAELWLPYRAAGGTAGGMQIRLPIGSPGMQNTWQANGSFHALPTAATSQAGWGEPTVMDYPASVNVSANAGGPNSATVNTATTVLYGRHHFTIPASITTADRVWSYEFHQRVAAATLPTILVAGGILVLSKAG